MQKTERALLKKQPRHQFDSQSFRGDVIWLKGIEKSVPFFNLLSAVSYHDSGVINYH
jgi:hypothetical protein